MGHLRLWAHQRSRVIRGRDTLVRGLAPTRGAVGQACDGLRPVATNCQAIFVRVALGSPR